jgi:uncharacterized phage infection (PIP) family protein YhgE
LNRLTPEQRAANPNLVPELQAQAAQLAESYRRTNEQLDPLNRAVENFEQRLGMAVAATEVYTTASRGLLESLFSGTTEFREAMRSFTQTISQGFVKQFLDIAIAPMQEQVFDRMKKLFGVESAQDKANREFANTGIKFNTAVSTFDAAVNTFRSSLSAGIGGPDLPAGIAAQVGAIAPSQMTRADLEFMPAGSIDYVLTDAFKGIGESLTRLGTTAETTGKQANNAANEGEKGFTKFLGGMMGVATGALSIAGGIQQMQEGGTSNTLAGIGSILLGIGGAIGGLGSMGLFGKKAGGGAISANRPYLVGEVGPEIVVPRSSGTVMSNNQLREAMSTGVGGTRAPQLNMTFQTTSIGGVEYVSREQLEAAMASTRRAAVRDGARQGMSMTLDKLQQSPGTRGRVGLR